MSYHGGYKIINFGETALTTGGSAVKIGGIYAAIEMNYRKVTLLSGLVIDNVEKNDVWAIFKVSGDNFEANIPGVGIITITEEDEVSVKADNSFDLPAVPSANGTYWLQAVKSNSGVAYSWSALPETD